ncbi:MAG: hypothetical protein HY900_12800 [Deltaproteobacteria bacterium]|nr:hypothetical protein [Deltaproteobacteria bacterium]
MAEKKIPSRRTSVPKVKEEAIQSYQEALPIAQEKREAELRPEERITEKAGRRAVETADSISLDGIIREVGTLKLELGKVLGSLTERLEREVGRYESVRQAVELKEKELQEIYEIQKSASSLAALLEAQHRKREEFEMEMAERREALAKEMDALRTQWAEEKARNEAAATERDEAERRRREREEEEFQYARDRERRQAKDQFEAEKARYEEERAKLEREVGLKREQLAKELADREQAVRQSEEELQELRRRAAAFPKELEAAVSREVKASADRVRAEATAREELLKKEFEGERNVLKTRIGGLETAVKEQAEQISKLALQLERSYGQIQDIAVKAIEGSSGARAPSPNPLPRTAPFAAEG